ncbi:spore germination protein [Neobacillus sp. FSL H8-0543]|uniref:spore germination protein n=1 Tax=Neobacillus sp. FSL H8-0543 TaxID=2954672 RepID=UPI00315970E3
MFFKKKLTNYKKEKGKSVDEDNTVPTNREEMSNEFRKRLQHSADILETDVAGTGITLFYLHTLIDMNLLHKDIIEQIKNQSFHSIENIMEQLSVAIKDKTNQLDKVIQSAISGHVIIQLEGESEVIFARIASNTGRTLSAAMNETQVIGPQIAFNESLSTNLSLIRKYITDPNLSIENIQIGTQSTTSVSLVHIHAIANQQMVDLLRERIKKINIDGILDSSVLLQLIEDNSLSIFPQMVLTERPDRICSWLLMGKLVVLVDGSSLAIACPQSFLEFFQSMEDNNIHWQVATFLRLLRMFALILSIFFTAFYVAALTFHYEVIPQTLLIPLSESRARVPFPPILEALFMEFIIELLRESAARLPTKVGQTIGIVGGIVIGTASVDAGFTSNILIIIVALGALASFTTPNYSMGNIVRVLRFPIIILAGFWGFYGIMFGFCFILIHLLRQSSLGVPVLLPFYPPRLADWKDSVIRLPLTFTYNRPKQTRPEDDYKYDPLDAKEKE